MFDGDETVAVSEAALPDGPAVGVHVELAAAIDGLYAAVADVPRPASVHFGDPAVPLRGLPAAALAGYAAKALTTIGDADALRAVVPRLLEICIVDDDPDWPDVEAVVGKFGYDGPGNDRPWWTWPETEQAAIRHVLRAWWRSTLSGDVDDHRTDSVLCAIGCCEPPAAFDWYLDEWLRPGQPLALDHLVRFVDRNASLSHTGRLWNSFWTTRTGPARTNCARVIAWLAQFR